MEATPTDRKITRAGPKQSNRGRLDPTPSPLTTVRRPELAAHGANDCGVGCGTWADPRHLRRSRAGRDGNPPHSPCCGRRGLGPEWTSIEASIGVAALPASQQFAHGAPVVSGRQAVIDDYGAAWREFRRRAGISHGPAAGCPYYI